ncbi:hypothetical protein KC354_g2962 [Hortaea werneckii]|nr:hypothetical protein KC354_g2962 [Hortaea werneckii]
MQVDPLLTRHDTKVCSTGRVLFTATLAFAATVTYALDVHNYDEQAVLAPIEKSITKATKHTHEAIRPTLLSTELVTTTALPGFDTPAEHWTPDRYDPYVWTVQWNRKLRSISTDDPLPTLNFADGTTATGFDLIVGADGAWSHVRPTLTDERPFFSGIGGYSLVIPQAQRQTPKLFDLVNRGSVFAFSDGKSLTAQYMSDGSINVGVWGVRAEAMAGEDRKKMNTNHDIEDSKISLKSDLREQYHDWHPDLQAFIQEADDEKMVPRDLFMLPIRHRWEHRPGVTLIGDAAHLMGPWAGEGVNLALEDALKLSEAIITSATTCTSTTTTTDSLGEKKKKKKKKKKNPNPTLNHQHIQTFEHEMFARATRTQQMTWTMMEAMLLTPGAPRTSIERYLLTAVGSGIGGWAGWVLAPIVYAWFFVFKLIW